MPVKKSKRSAADNIDAALSEMLYDVPAHANSSIKIPKRVPRLTPSRPTQSLASTSTTLASTQSHKFASGSDGLQADLDDGGHRAKRLRASDPSFIVEDSNPFSDDGYYATESSSADPAFKTAIGQQMATQESEVSTGEPEPALEDSSGIEVAPLDEDTKKNLHFIEADDGRQYTHFYWYDCCEGPVPGTVYFFGRIQVPASKFVSCCAIVKNVTRTFYLLLAPNCAYDEAVGEFTNITAKKYRIKSFVCKKATKRFAFGAGVPMEADYVQVECPAGQPVLPADATGVTFSAVLNVNQSPMEKLILELKLRGPTWLRLIEPKASTPQITWTRIELVLESPAHLQVEQNPVNLAKPYFCVLSLALQTYAHPNIPGRNDIIAISVMTKTCFRLDECLSSKTKGGGHFMIMTKPPASQKEHLRLPWDFQTALKTRFKQTRLDLMESERDLLTIFMEKFNQLDPDIVVGHDLLNYDFETLVKQMAINKVGAWDKLGRFKRSTLPSSKKAFPYLFSGRVLCDIKKSAEELMQLRAYDLSELSLQILDRKRIEYNHAKIVESYKTSDGLLELLRETWRDVDSIFSILVEMNIIPLALKITNITGNILSRTLAAGRSERNEYLLLHAFHEENFICPEKVQAWEKKAAANRKVASGAGDEAEDQPAAAEHQGRRKAAYTGGLVLEPKAGFYETAILLMDFNSLYPSIIQEFNICFSTVKVPPGASGGDAEDAAADIPSESAATGVLPAQLKQLVARRREVKYKMKTCKDAAQLTLLDIEQRALKLTANSMYGCLGFEYSRFYAKHLASLVTSKGREILMSTKAMVENLGYEVIYGDTDSLMIDTKLTEYTEVMLRGKNIKEEINRRFKLLEIDVDGVYQPLLLLKKKNYAGASLSLAPGGGGPAQPGQEPEVVRKIETKGLDSVRRDRAVIAKEAGEHILGLIMEPGRDICQTVQEIHNYLKDLSGRVNRNELPVEKYLISKQLNKNPEEYRDTKGIGHVTIALRLNSDPSRTRKMRAGDVINYAICTDETSESANQRGYTLEEMRAQPDKLKIDHEYYLCQQIYPAVSRICDKLPHTNAYAIAEAMGVEGASGIKIPRDPAGASVLKDQLVSKGEQRFVSCDPLAIECPSCTYVEQIRSKARKPTGPQAKGNRWLYALVECSNCNARFAAQARKVVVQVIGHIKRLTQRVYNPRFNCPDCDYSTRNAYGPLNEQGRPVCVRCATALVAEMDDRMMDLQLSYYKYLLDIQNDEHHGVAQQQQHQIEKPSDDVVDLYKNCFDEMLAALKMSFINTIDAQTVFSMICSSS